MSKLIEEYADQILSVIKQSNHILLHNHPSPDADSVGSALSMQQVLQSLGKEVTVIGGDSSLQPAFNCLKGYDQVVAKNWFEVDLSQFDLFVSLDSATIELVSSKGEVVFPPNLQTVVIDHHSSNTKYAGINLVDPSFSSNCQLLFELYQYWHVEITSDIAKCLLLGIYTDTGGFRYLPTDYKTFEDAAKLVKIAPDYNQTISALLDHNSAGRVKFLGLALSNYQLYLNNHVAISAISNQQITTHQIDISDTEKSEAVNYLKSINGVEIGILVTEKTPGKLNISFRSRDGVRFNVADIASLLGGGGHSAAAATRIDSSIDQAIALLQKTIQKVYPELSDN